MLCPERPTDAGGGRSSTSRPAVRGSDSRLGAWAASSDEVELRVHPEEDLERPEDLGGHEGFLGWPIKGRSKRSEVANGVDSTRIFHIRKADGRGFDSIPHPFEDIHGGGWAVFFCFFLLRRLPTRQAEKGSTEGGVDPVGLLFWEKCQRRL